MHFPKKASAKSIPLSPLTCFFLLLFLLIPFKSYADTSFCSGQLLNGLTYFIHHNPLSKKHISLDFVIKVGPLDEQEDEKGFSHLIEHSLGHNMEFKGKKITDLRCQIWDFSSPNIEALTTYDFTQFHFDISLAIPQALEETLLGMAKPLSPFFLDEPYLRSMKDEILEELDEIELSPVESWKRWKITQEYPQYRDKHPQGTQETISQASVEKLHQFYEKKYQPHRMALIIMGNVDLQRTKELIEKNFGHLSATDKEEILRSHSEPSSGVSQIYIDKRLKNTQISLTKPLPKMSQRNFLIFSIFTRLLSQHLRNLDKPQTLFSQPVLEILTYPKMLRLTVSLAEVSEGVDQLEFALGSFFNKPITEDQLDPIKAEISKNLKILQEKGNDPFLADFYRDQFIANATSSEIDHPDLRTSFLETIYAEDISRMIHAFQGFSQASICSSDQSASLISSDLFSKILMNNTDLWRNAYVD